MKMWEAIMDPSRDPYQTGYKISCEVWIHNLYLFAKDAEYCSLCFLP